MRKNCSGPIIYLRTVGHIVVVIHHRCCGGAAQPIRIETILEGRFPAMAGFKKPGAVGI